MKRLRDIEAAKQGTAEVYEFVEPVQGALIIHAYVWTRMSPTPGLVSLIPEHGHANTGRAIIMTAEQMNFLRIRAQIYAQLSSRN